MIDVYQEVLSAEKRIRPYIRETPLDDSFYLSRIANCHAFLKLENLQYTGSFKIRGAINKLLTLSNSERQAGVIAASTGNHGLAVAFGADKLGIKSSIFLPENASAQKVSMLGNYPVELHFYGTNGAETERYAREQALKNGRTYISPYNDPDVIGGQGTITVELFNQLKSVDCIMASVGGGGLIAGIGGYAKVIKNDIKIIGCLAQNSPVMYDSVRAGRITDAVTLPTLSDGTAGGIENEAITLEPCTKYVDDWVLVAEDEIRDALKKIFKQHRYVIEGAAGVTVAAFLKIKQKLEGKNVALVICGGNIEIDKFKAVVFL